MSTDLGLMHKSCEVSGSHSESPSMSWLRPSQAYLTFFHMDETTDHLFQYPVSGHQHLMLHKGGEMFFSATYGVANNGCLNLSTVTTALKSTGNVLQSGGVLMNLNQVLIEFQLGLLVVHRNS